MGRLPRRPELSLGRRSAGPRAGLRRHERDDHAPPRAVEPRREDATRESDGSLRPGVHLRRRRRGRAGRAGRATRRSCSRSPARRDGRTAARSPNVMPTRVADFTQLRPRDRGALLGSQPGVPVRSLLVGLERAEPAALPAAAVRLARAIGRARELREALRGRVRRHQGRQPAREGRDRRDLRSRQRQARRAPPDALARQVRGARREGQPAGSSSTPGRTTRTRSTRTRRRRRS